MKALFEHMSESFDIVEAKVDDMSRFEFQYMGSDYTIKKLNGKIIDTTDGKSFNIETLKAKGVVFTDPYAAKKVKNTPAKLMSKQNYEKQIKGIAQSGGIEASYDTSINVMLDHEMVARVKKDYPSLKTDEEIRKRIQWDIEAWT